MAEHETRTHLREALADLEPGLRILVADVLGEGSRIDWVARDAHGRAVVVLVGGRGESAALLTRAIAQSAWLEPRIRDWLKLAPQLDLDPEAAPRCLLLCPGFESDTRAAARALVGHRVELVLLRENAGRHTALLQRVETTDGTEAAPMEPLPPFRSGLRESDLELTPEERREFE